MSEPDEFVVFEANREQGWTAVDLSATPPPPASPESLPAPSDGAGADAGESPAVETSEAVVPDEPSEVLAPVLEDTSTTPPRGERRRQQLEEQIQDSLARRRAAREEEAALAAQIAARRAELSQVSGAGSTAPTQPIPVNPSPQALPGRDQYPDEGAYLAAVAAWSGERGAEAAFQRSQLLLAEQTIIQKHQAGELTYPDYRAVITNPDLEPLAELQPVLRDFIATEAAPQHVLYYLGTHPEAFAEFQDLNPRGAARFLARLATTVTPPAAPPSPAMPRIALGSGAPLRQGSPGGLPPVRPLSGGGTGPVLDRAAVIAEGRGDFAAYCRARDAEERSERR